MFYNRTGSEIVRGMNKMTSGNLFGYARVSARDQNESRQLLALSRYSIPQPNLFIDKQSGKNFDRPAYQQMLRRLKKGDRLIVSSIDRLGRNYEEIIEQWRLIVKEKGADILVLDMPLLDTAHDKDLLGTFISDLVLQLLSYIAENERNTIRRRQAEGIAAARQRGVRFGRPAAKLPEEFPLYVQQWRQNKRSARELAVEMDISVKTFYNYAKAVCEFDAAAMRT